MFSEDDSTRLMVILGVIGTLLGVVLRILHVTPTLRFLLAPWEACSSPSFWLRFAASNSNWKIS